MDKNEVLVSVVIPAFNAEKTIERAILSVVNQPQGRLCEVICVNDGSSDGTRIRIDNLAAQNCRVRTFHQANLGVSATRNRGIDLATGKYIAFLDADDWWNENVFDERVADYLHISQWDLYSFGYSAVTSNYKYVYENHVKNGVEEYHSHARGRYHWFHFCSFMYRREFLLENRLRFLNTKVNEDQPFVEMCFYLANGVRRIDKLLFTYWSNVHSCLHTVDYLSYLEEKCRSLDETKKWYNKYGEDYEVEGSYLLILSEVLPELCVQKSISEIQRMLQVDSRFECLKNYQMLSYNPKLMNSIRLWVEYPWLYWFTARTIYLPKSRMKQFLYKHPTLREPVDAFYYQYIRKYKKVKR